MSNTIIPSIVFHTRVRNSSLKPNPFEWKDVKSEEIFSNRNIVLFALPGAFSPSCSDSQLPGYEDLYNDFLAQGVDEVICLSVNDAHVMSHWAKAHNIENIHMLPDGNGEFTERMGMLISRSKHGMGDRSWRYSIYVENGYIKKIFSEPNFRDNPDSIPVTVSGAETILNYLQLR